MNPTPEQLNAWSAEVLYPVRAKHQGDQYIANNDKKPPEVHKWYPSTNLSQAWREFVPVLQKREYYCLEMDSAPRVVGHEGIQYDGMETILIAEGQGETPDAKAAYALTYAFVQAMEPKGYMEWLRLQPRS